MKKGLIISVIFFVLIVAPLTDSSEESEICVQASSSNSSARILAVANAARWYDDRNPAYGEPYDDMGGNCQNFVSQVLELAGFSSGGEWTPDSYAWITVEGFQKFVEDNRINNTVPDAPKGITYTSQTNDFDELYCYDIEVGDVLQFFNSSDGGYWSHSTIFMGGSEGMPTFAANTSDEISTVQEKCAMAILQGYSYSKIRIIHITNYAYQ